MRYSKLGSTDMSVSALTVGTWAIGGAGWGDVDRKESIAAIKEMINNGVNFIDTAIVYNDSVSEQIVGEAIRGMRDKIYISTKGGIFNKGKHVVRDGTKENIFEQCNESLKNLGTDYIDVYFVHWPDHNVPFAETMDALNELKKAGKIRHIGVSNFTIDDIYEAGKYATIDAFQPPYSMVERSQEYLIKWIHGHNTGVMTYGSLGAGVLTGAFRSLPKFDPFDFRYIFYDYFVDPKFSKIMELLKTLDKVAAAHKAPVSHVALNWNTQKGFVDTSIIGVRNPKEAKENCAAMEWKLGDDEINEIDKAIENTLGKK